MKTTHYMPVVLCAALVALCAGWAGAQAPRIVLPEPTYNFGEADNSQTIERAFEVRNEGDAPLEIRNVRSSCGCTVAHISHHVIEPGGSGTITGRLNLRGRNGPQNSMLTIESNDPAQPQVRASIVGKAVAVMTFYPPHVFFGNLASREAAEREVQIVGQSSDPFSITGVRVDQPWFDAAHETPGVNSSHRIKLTSRSPLPLGALRAHLHVETDNPRMPSIDIPISVNVVGEIAFMPSQINVSAGSDRPVTRYVMVQPGSVPEYTITGVEAPDPSIQVIVHPVAPSRYRIQLNNIVATEELDGQTLKIHTDVAGMDQIEIPFEIIH